MTVIYKARSKTLFNKFHRNSPDRARLTSISTPYSGSWLITPPLNPLFTIHDVNFSLATRLRLGLPLFDNISRCTCGNTIDKYLHHFMSCEYLNSHRIVRHDRMVQVLTQIARRCGVVTKVEPRIDGEDKSRGDGLLYFHSQTSIFDLQVIDPAAKSYIIAAQQPLGAAVIGETRKRKLYEIRCKDEGHLFYPLIFESYGGIGVRCRDLVSKIVEEASLNGVTSLEGMPVRSYILRALSFCLQSGNALLAIHGSKKARERL